MFRIEKKIVTFSAAHRLLNYDGACANLHGHNYDVYAVLQAENLDNHDFVIDFGVIKKTYKTWVDENFDHGVLVNKNDSALLEFLKKEQQKYFIIDANPSAEIIAQKLFEVFSAITPAKIKLHSVKVFETENSSALYES